eukprot:m.244115 g.244115  ORF g.244115 m.244115 type:complete len:729 (+) comp19032_c2_seq1:344-2530(+)
MPRKLPPTPKLRRGSDESGADSGGDDGRAQSSPSPTRKGRKATRRRSIASPAASPPRSGSNTITTTKGSSATPPVSRRLASRAMSESTMRSLSTSPARSPLGRRRSATVRPPSSPTSPSSTSLRRSSSSSHMTRSRSFSSSPRSSRRPSVTGPDTPQPHQPQATKVKVVVRIRPKLAREKGEKVVVSVRDNQIKLANLRDDTSKSFAFDHAFWSVKKNDPHYVNQQDVFDHLGCEVLDNAFSGINACVFAYGQTGSGKTHTMIGSEGSDEGIIPRLCKGIFERIKASTDSHTEYKVEVSYLQVYNEKVQDLLGRPRKSLKVREHRLLGPYVQGLSKLAVSNHEAIATLMSDGNQLRSTAATGMNDTSSRSHAIVSIYVTQQFKDDMSGHVGEKVSRLNLVDLAGSERLAKSGAVGDRLVEGANINKSLTTLGLVISALADRATGANKSKFVPYRDSVLTFLLKDSLGGNSRTVMVATISPADGSFEESMSTLRYADRAKQIVTHAKVNEDPNARLIRELREELELLRAQVAQGGAAGDQDQTNDAELAQLRSTLEETEGFINELSESWEEKLAATQRVLLEKQSLLEQLQAEKETLETAEHENQQLRLQLAQMEQRMADESRRADDDRRRVLALEACLERQVSDDPVISPPTPAEALQAQQRSDVETLVVMTGFDETPCRAALERANFDLAKAASVLMQELQRVETEKLMQEHQEAALAKGQQQTLAC